MCVCSIDKNHRTNAKEKCFFVEARSEPKTTTNLSNQKPPWRSEGSTTSRPLGSARQGGSCFAAWWFVLRGVVVAGLGGYRSEKRATPWVSPWWWLASVVTDLRREPRRGSLLGGDRFQILSPITNAGVSMKHTFYFGNLKL
uniref:Uncharacterized protein n=1 Tax=Fagus sylvatica TaxID=28930 RepID=A0A2N9GY20_FAGSY